ncbi:hypothetical protein AN958_10017 [Leucoagaricus sp. SymC.cos]|nr:hypothetical protein AN958_10017 [Leucoagaricus sp. SymC.cos]
MEPSVTEENHFLDVTSARMEEEIQVLLIQRALLRRRANSFRDKTFIFPPETLTTIFEHAIRGNSHPILRLAAVCFRWRRVIWDTPTLWTHIMLCSKQAGVWQMLSLHLENAKDASLSIRLPTHYGLGTPLNPILDLVRAVYIDCAEKTRRLDFGPIDKLVWDVLASHSAPTEFPRLEAAKLEFETQFYAGLPKDLFCHSPLLRSVELKNPLPGIEHYLPFHQLTSLSLQNCGPTHALYLLSHCPELISFHSGDGSPGICDDKTFTLGTSVMLRDLRFLKWESGEIPHVANFIADIHLPSVEELYWQDPLEPTAKHLWEPFFARMSGVRVLECKFSPGTIDLLNTFRSLEVVHIRFDGFFDNLQAITHLVSRLAWTEEGSALPYLKEFTITLEDKEKVMSEKRLPFLDALIQTVKSRRVERNAKGCTLLEKLTLKLSFLVVWGTWHRHLVNSLNELKQRGLRISIIH